jgi:hypothetical protein
MPFRTSLGSRQGLPRPSSLRGGSGIRGSSTSHCSSVRSMLRSSCHQDARRAHYTLRFAFMRWLLAILAITLGVANRIGKPSSKARGTFSVSVSANEPHKKSSASRIRRASAPPTRVAGGSLMPLVSRGMPLAARHSRSPRPFCWWAETPLFLRIGVTSVPYLLCR